MENNALTQQEALKDLSAIKKVLNETSHQVGKLYLFFYVIAALYLLYPIGNLFFLLFVNLSKSQTILINEQPYLFNKDASYLGSIMIKINLFYVLFPLFIIVAFCLIKFKKLKKNQRFAHKLLNIWGYGFMTIHVGTFINSKRLLSVLSSDSLYHTLPENYEFGYSLYRAVPPLITCVVILFIYLIMNLLTDKKLFILLFIINFICYFTYIYFLPPFALDMSQIFNYSTRSMFIEYFWLAFPSLLLAINFMIIGSYFKKMYRAEQIAYED